MATSAPLTSLRPSTNAATTWTPSSSWPTFGPDGEAPYHAARVVAGARQEDVVRRAPPGRASMFDEELEQTLRLLQETPGAGGELAHGAEPWTSPGPHAQAPQPPLLLRGRAREGCSHPGSVGSRTGSRP